MEYKTNVMRVLDKLKVKYGSYSYGETEAISGIEVANILGQDPRRVFKTLVTVGKSKKNYVFMIPVAAELDLKKAALSVNEKSIELISMKELLPLTGYVHGGCSPIGMKKSFHTIVDSSAESFNLIIFSAGKIGYQVEISLLDLKKAIQFELVEVIIR